MIGISMNILVLATGGPCFLQYTLRRTFDPAGAKIWYLQMVLSG